MAQKMKQDEDHQSSSFPNVTLPASERQKRLLPYMTFYLDQDFNRPQNLQVPKQSYVLQQKPQPQAQHHQQQQQPEQIKYYKYQPIVDAQKILVEPKSKYTPFLDSNALPGPFLPMGRPNPQQKLKLDIEKLPNYSAIYDKLSQLKLQQNVRYVPQYKPNYSSIRTLAYKPQQVHQQHHHHQPVPQHQFQQQELLHQHHQHPNAKPLHYAPSLQALDLPPEYDYHQQIPAPIKSYAQLPSKSYVHEQYPVQEPITIRTQEYINDQKQYHREEVRKPVYIYRSKPQKEPTTFLQLISTHNNEKPSIIYVQKQPIPHQNQPIVHQNQPIVHQSHPILNQNHPIVNQNHPLVNQNQHLAEQNQHLVQHTQHLVQQNQPLAQQNQHPLLIETKPGYIKERAKPQVIFEQDQQSMLEHQEKMPQEVQHVHQQPQQILASQQEDVSYQNLQLEQGFRPLHQVEEPQQIASPPNYPSLKYETIQSESTTEDPNNLGLILKRLQDNNALPHTLTPDNIDNSIKTLVRILSALKKQQKFVRPIVVEEDPTTSRDYGEDFQNEAGVGLGGNFESSIQHFPEDTPEGGTPGKPGVDYPALSSIPPTSFNCKTQRYKGFFGDPDTHCQVWHYCDLNGGQASFLCPNGTIFSQVALTCDWWYNVKCATTAQLYVLNERLYKYILPLSPKFPEDYSGPLVDRYLALKFREMEAKMKKERKQKGQEENEEEKSESKTDDADDLRLASDKTTTETAASYEDVEDEETSSEKTE